MCSDFSLKTFELLQSGKRPGILFFFFNFVHLRVYSVEKSAQIVCMKRRGTQKGGTVVYAVGCSTLGTITGSEVERTFGGGPRAHLRRAPFHARRE